MICYIIHFAHRQFMYYTFHRYIFVNISYSEIELRKHFIDRFFINETFARLLVYPST